MSGKISSFRDLRVYQESFRLQQKIFPVEEKYSLTDQIRRSSRSIGGNIAEAWQKRQYPAHFVSKLTDSDGEQAETQHWLHTAKECQYISSENYDELLHECLKIGRMLGKMINNPSPFIKKP